MPKNVTREPSPLSVTFFPQKDQSGKMCWRSQFPEIQANPGKHKRCSSEIFFFSALVSTLPSAPTLGNSTLKEEEMMSQQRARLNGSPLIPHWLTSGQVAASQGQHQVHLQQLFSFSYLDMSSLGYADSTMFCKTWLQMSITETKRDSQSMQNLTMVLLRLMADGDRNKHFDCLLTDLMYVCSTHMAPHFFVL